MERVLKEKLFATLSPRRSSFVGGKRFVTLLITTCQKFPSISYRGIPRIIVNMFRIASLNDENPFPMQIHLCAEISGNRQEIVAMTQHDRKRIHRSGLVQVETETLSPKMKRTWGWLLWCNRKFLPNPLTDSKIFRNVYSLSLLLKGLYLDDRSFKTTNMSHLMTQAKGSKKDTKDWQKKLYTFTSET